LRFAVVVVIASESEAISLFIRSNVEIASLSLAMTANCIQNINIQSGRVLATVNQKVLDFRIDFC